MKEKLKELQWLSENAYPDRCYSVSGNEVAILVGDDIKVYLRLNGTWYLIES